MLNFEDSDPNFDGKRPNRILLENPGTTFKRSPTLAASGAAQGPAQGAAAVYANRIGFGSKSYHKGQEVSFYPCRELIDLDRKDQLSRKDMDEIRQDCQSAKTIGIIIHGGISDTEHGWATDKGQVCTWKELGQLMLLLLPAADRIYNIALIMCYGARSSNAKLDHDGRISPTDLKTSFAYKLFRTICVGRNVRMSARIGLVRTDYMTNFLVETEEGTRKQILYQESFQLQGMNKVTMDQKKIELCTRKHISAELFDTIVKQFAMTPTKEPNGELQKFAKQYVIYSDHLKTFIDNSVSPEKIKDRSQYGKLIYKYSNGTLEIISRYDLTSDGLAYTLYKGALL